MMLNDLQVWASRYPGNGFCGIWILDYITTSVPSLLKWLQKWRIWALYKHSNLSLVINRRQAFETEVTLCHGGLIFFLGLLLHFEANTAPELNDSTSTRCWKQISFGCITVCSRHCFSNHLQQHSPNLPWSWPWWLLSGSRCDESRACPNIATCKLSKHYPYKPWFEKSFGIFPKLGPVH